MHCPFCLTSETKVVDSRLGGEGEQVRRRRECLACNERFTTFEMAELNLPRVIKTDNRRQPFNEEKLRQGLMRALEKRPISMHDVDEVVMRIIRQLRALGEKEVESRLIGEMLMQELRQIDEVAYVRFASVYRRFQDVNEFYEEIVKLQQATTE